MIGILNDSLLKIIGSVDTKDQTMINGIECLRNKHGTVFKVDNLGEAELFLAEKFPLLDRFYPDGIMMKKIFKEYPFMVLLKNELNLDYPDCFHYQYKEPLVIEYKDCCYIFCEMENKLEGLL